ncbi:carbohydrate ABC transporter permease [Paenibacillus campinasensis]|uniref:ABC transporter permease n=1 Tax=Paenibacillus campinasensis TaxID=66347 RepID=A0A268EPV4_9BACL|nr:sugar ABC transporter permease [Paenibacillus campinasensis]PAD75154.1 ABC transporter permease [Paenibacillus campinasensis]
MNTKERAWFLLFTVPLLFIFTTVVVVPFTIGIFYSFIAWDGISANPKTFVGFKNFIDLFRDEQFYSSAWHTVKFTVLSLLGVNIVGIVLSLLVTSNLKVKHAARTMFFLPNLIGGLILGYIWKFIFSDVTTLLGEKTGMDVLFFNWLLNPQSALYAMVIVFAWQMAGYTMLIYVAGILGIPDEMLEAAKVDGANLWQRTTRIIFPLLMPAFTICLFLTLSGAFKVYDINLSLTGGGPFKATEMFAMNIFNEMFTFSHYGLGQAKAIIFFIVVALITLLQVVITKKREVQM